MSDLTTTLPEGFEPSISRLTVGRLNHLAMEANGVILCLTQRQRFQKDLNLRSPDYY